MKRFWFPGLIFGLTVAAVVIVVGVSDGAVPAGPHGIVSALAAESAAAAIPQDSLPQSLREQPEDLEFEVLVDGDRKILLPLEAIFVLPGETVELESTVSDGSLMGVRAEDGRLARNPDDSWRWTAPDTPGATSIVFDHQGVDDVIRINAFVMTPADRVESGRLGGYRIGSYPATPLAGNPIYDRPEGFARVDETTHEMKVSPHFELGQFTSKQSWDFPKYVVLRPALLLKLELLLQAMADRGYPFRSFHIMSGYRTPHYNVNVLGNVQYSRHQWGGAADIFVDELPENGRMDDLNGDGKVNTADIAVIRSVVDSLEAAREDFPVGGLGVYRANSVRGPFVHLDVRGTQARW